MDVNLHLGDTQLIIRECLRNNLSVDHAAYVLATAFWETGRSMKPVEEAYYVSRSAQLKYLRSKRYWPFYGRGYVQLTWEYNYVKATRYFQDVLKIDVDFVKNPEKLLVPEYAAIILVVGSKEGWFTGKDLDDFIDDVEEDYAEELREVANARRIINGLDKAAEIGKIALQYEIELRASGYGETGPVLEPVETIDPPAPPVVAEKPEPEPVEVKVHPLVALLMRLAVLLGTILRKRK